MATNHAVAGTAPIGFGGGLGGVKSSTSSIERVYRHEKEWHAPEAGAGDMGHATTLDPQRHSNVDSGAGPRANSKGSKDVSPSNSKDGSPPRSQGTGKTSIWNLDVKSIRTHVDAEDELFEHKTLVDRWQFHAFFGVVILLNAICIGIETDVGASDHAEGGITAVLKIFEVGFLVLFVVELLLRMFYAPTALSFIRDLSNVMDFILVVMGFLSLFLEASGFRQVTVLRVLRLLKLYRLLRLVRFFKQLWLLLTGLYNALRVLSWVLVLLTLVMFILAVFFTQQYAAGTSGLSHVEGVSQEQLSWKFGSVSQSMWTLFQLLTLENWTTWATNIVRNEPAWSVFFVLFIVIMHFGLLSLVVAVVVEETLAAAHSQEKALQKKEHRNKQRTIDLLKRLFLAIDTSGDGRLSFQEFTEAMQDEEIVDAFKSIKIPAQDFDWLFALLDEDEDDGIEINEFVNGCLRISGIATAKDLFEIHLQLAALAMKVKTFQKDTFPSFENKLVEKLSALSGVQAKGSTEVGLPRGLQLEGVRRIQQPTEWPQKFEGPQMLNKMLEGVEQGIDKQFRAFEAKVDSLVLSLTQGQPDVAGSRDQVYMGIDKSSCCLSKTPCA